MSSGSYEVFASMIPALNHSGIIPPYVNPIGPGAHPADMTPFRATCEEFVTRFLLTPQRQMLLRRWLDHRADMRAIGIVDGSQWLDGSFVENKIPKDIDVVTYFRRPKDPTGRPISNLTLDLLLHTHVRLFNRSMVKSSYFLDAFFLDLDGNSRSLVNLTRYYCGLFSHQRVTDIWKGMVEVDLFDATETSAMKIVDAWAPTT